MTGVRCFDSVDGYQCGACPHGYVGNGEECKPRTGCATRPCSPGNHKIILLMVREWKFFIRTRTGK